MWCGIDGSGKSPRRILPPDKKFYPGDVLNMLHPNSTRVRLFAWLFSQSNQFWQSQIQPVRYTIQDMHIQALAWIQNHRTRAGRRCRAIPAELIQMVYLLGSFGADLGCRAIPSPGRAIPSPMPRSSTLFTRSISTPPSEIGGLTMGCLWKEITISLVLSTSGIKLPS